MSVTIGQASYDENGGIIGAKKGDQTGKEVKTGSWYSNSWTFILRPKNKLLANKMATLCEAACKNNNVGYSQYTRGTLLTEARKVDGDISKITTSCACDCSSLIATCAILCGVNLGSSIPRCAEMKTTYLNSGQFEASSSSKWLTSDDYLLRGDILVKIGSKGNHTIMILSNGEKVEQTFSPPPSTTTTTTTTPSPQVDKTKPTTTIQPEAIWKFLISKIKNPYGVAGLMGNLYCKSTLSSINLQQSYEKKLGYSDSQYTSKVDSGAYSRHSFTRDSAGYGLAQWTYYSRKEKLYDYCRSLNGSIGNLYIQLEFLWKELSEDYTGVLDVLKNATSVKKASNKVLFDFESPKDQGSSVQEKRAKKGQEYYDSYKNITADMVNTSDTQEAEIVEEPSMEILIKWIAIGKEE